MSDPKRWKETEDRDVRALLQGLSDVEPAAEAREGVWRKLVVTLPPTPGSDPSGGASGGNAAPSVARGSATAIGKASVAVVAAIGAGALAVALWRPSPPAHTDARLPPPVPSPIAPSPPVLAVSEIAQPMAEATAPSPKAVRSPPARRPREDFDAGALASPAPPPAASIAKPDRLREEAEGLRKARRLLRENQSAAALAELDGLARRFPAGPLEEEREVLTIEALVASGDEAAGRRRAERFLFEHSQSMHTGRVRNLVSK